MKKSKQSPIPNPQSSILFIVGPTASGKSDLAIKLSQKLKGEIICADSRTVYKGLDIATAKPSLFERSRVQHWGLDLKDPNERFSAADFKKYAEQKITEIQGRGKLPIIVGGTGLYIDGLLFDFAFGPEADNELRNRLEQKTVIELQELIISKAIEMPENKQNKRYLIRVIEQGGINKKRKSMQENATVIGLKPQQEILEGRIKERAQKMLDSGALEEARLLFQKCGTDVPAAAAPFFRAYQPLIFGEENATLESCKHRDIVLNRQLAKRQISWFKRNKNIVWFEKPEDAFEHASELYS